MIAPLRVGLRWPGAPARRGGVDVYAEGLARALVAHGAGQSDGAGESEVTALVAAGTEPPTDADVTITAGVAPDEAARQILEHLVAEGYVGESG